MKTILLVEDSADDAFLLRRALQRVGVNNPLHIVGDGEQAVQYLSGRGRFNREEHPLPCLVMLDLKLPGCTGHEVLHWIRSHPTLYSLPVVVLTGSDLTEDVELAYKLGADFFLTKPQYGEALEERIRHLSGFWQKFNVVLGDCATVSL